VKNYYIRLGVSEKASIEEIRERYKFLLRKHHPDHYTEPIDREKADELCKAFGEAFNNLKSPKDRRKHDEELKARRKHDEALKKARIKKEPIITISKNLFDLGELQYNEKKKISFIVDYVGSATPSFEIDWLKIKPSWADLDFKPTPIKGYPLEVIVNIQPGYNLVEDITYTNTLQVTIAQKSYEIVIRFKLKAQQVKISENNFDLGLLKADEKKQISFSINYPVNTFNVSWQRTKPVWGDLNIEGNGSSTIVTVNVHSKDYLTDGQQESVIRVDVKNKFYDIHIKFISNHEPKIEFSDLKLDFGRLSK
jgi:hypothetical protein